MRENQDFDPQLISDLFELFSGFGTSPVPRAEAASDSPNYETVAQDLLQKVKKSKRAKDFTIAHIRYGFTLSFGGHRGISEANELMSSIDTVANRTSVDIQDIIRRANRFLTNFKKYLEDNYFSGKKENMLFVDAMKK